MTVMLAAWWLHYRPVAEERGWEEVTYTFALCGEAWAGASGCVVDGDTLIIGSGDARRRIRVAGFDAPELDGACPAERAMALRAKAALHQWLAMGWFQWNGADDPPYDQYGRELREIRRVNPDGDRDYLAEAMVGQGLAGESGWATGDVDWCA